ncbi:hypothetical protein E1263_23205 [Kribbella antibiotica]|uniref:Uncharacterized protein n=1 Tax=Kribbella antibiotica TaxID=190195 RepID=A0A4R4ZIM3_9ACTN|nr:hypothetical protein [Kribbella antibiotica]TDD57584.1 hypothetical protein E1263_23205 [Kribbella antibiotica]
MSYVRMMPSDYEPERRSTRRRRNAASRRMAERTPLGKALRWLAEKSVNEFLDALLRLFLDGGWIVRLAGSVVTGVVAASAIWLLSGSVLSTLLGSSFTATAIGLSAVAGLVMGFGGGFLAGAGAGWLLAIAAESVSTELSKDKLGLYVASWIAWCLAALVGGLAGWAVGRLLDQVEKRSAKAGLALRALGYLLFFAAVTLVLVRTGAAATFWSWFAAPAEAVGRRSDAFVVGIGVGILGGAVVATYLLWLGPGAPPFGRRSLPLAQAALTAMIGTLAVVDTTAGSSLPVAATLIAAVWIVPLTVPLAFFGAANLLAHFSDTD